jgi:D-glycerate 3-kinase
METLHKIRKMADMTSEAINPQPGKDQGVSAVARKIARLKLPGTFVETVETHYTKVAEAIARRACAHRGTLMVSINGSQGSGKSTLTGFLELLLDERHGLNVANLSIDDFYLTREARGQLASNVHPLLATRGVPGTHDVELALSTLDCLRSGSAQGECRLPRFDKAQDDREDPSAWPSVRTPVDVILFEGWCNHAPVQSDEELADPVNRLERQEDRQGTWRRYVNQQLARYHEALFRQADVLVFLQAPSFEKVYEWRELQESKLRASSPGGTRVMNQQQLRRFIDHYERLTRACLRSLPQQADIVLGLDSDHRIVDVSGPGLAHD